MKTLSEVEKKVLLFLCEQKELGHTQPNVAAICDGTGLGRQVVRRALRALVEKKLLGGGPPDLLEEVMGLLSEQDPNLKATDPGYAEHVILLASAISKADEAFLAEELGYDLEFVSIVGSRLRSSGVWDGDHLSEDSLKGWTSDGGGLNFYLDGAIATGDLVAAERDKNGERQWKMTEKGLVRGADLIKKIAKPDDEL
jgi:hypothetical protein